MPKTLEISKQAEAPVDKLLFGIAASLTAVLVIVMIVFDKSMSVVLQKIFDFTTNQIGWTYIWTAALVTAVILWLSFGKYKGVKFGGPDAVKEFKTFSWLAMFFCSGIGTSLLVWASKEWAYYYVSPPFGIAARSIEAGELASAYPLFHWGFIGWAIYAIMAFPIGYAYWNKGYNSMRFSTSCIGVIGEKKAKGPLGKFIDFLLIFGLLGANATSLGSGTPMLAEACSRLIGITRTPLVDLFVVLIWTGLFTTSVTLGLKKGIKVLSDINIYLVIALCSFVFFLGPSMFMINNFTNSIGVLGREFFKMTFYTDAIGKSMFPQWWTVFYWAWYFAYAPYMGIFIARVSKGRTFREVGLGVLVFGTLGCALFFAILGNNALYNEMTGTFPFIETLEKQGDAAAILGSLMVLPFKQILLVVLVFIGFIYSATTIDSSAYCMALTSSKDVKGEAEPKWWNRMFWALMLGGVAVVVMKIGGLTALKTASLVVAFPIMIFICVALVSFKRWLDQDKPHLLVPSEKIDK
ncbi:MAG: BCCT family transporter [Spirochaetales bacterium]|nr:MAG: BCCT family transporter [Spirochaetales bacterium]